MRPGVTVSDYLTGVFAAEAALAALYRRDARGHRASGQSSTPRCTGRCCGSSNGRSRPTTVSGTVREREGNRLANSAPLDNYPTGDGRYRLRRGGPRTPTSRGLCQAMDRPGRARRPTLRDPWPNAPRTATTSTGSWRDWTLAHTADEIERACVASDVPVATAYSAREIASDPHFAERGDLVGVDDPVIGPLRQQAPFPRIVGEPAPVPTGAPELGAHNREVWCDLVGLSESELEPLRERHRLNEVVETDRASAGQRTGQPTRATPAAAESLTPVAAESLTPLGTHDEGTRLRRPARPGRGEARAGRRPRASAALAAVRAARDARRARRSGPTGW